MFSKIEKLIMILVAFLFTALFLVFLSLKTNKEKSICESMCNSRDSSVRVYEPGICICQK